MAVNGICRDPPTGNPRVKGAFSPLAGELGLGGKAERSGRSGFVTALVVVRPLLGQREWTVPEGLSGGRGIAKEYTDLTVLDTPGGSGIAPGHTAGLVAFLEKAGFVSDPYACGITQVFNP